MTDIVDFPTDQYEIGADPAYDSVGSALGDRRDGRVYVYGPEVRAAVRVALASGRPLLLRGRAGSGKSSLAPFIARTRRRRYYWTTITARSEARDLMWQFDALKRLNDAQVQDAADRRRIAQLHSYLEPGVLWWAFSPTTAARRGLDLQSELLVPLAKDPGIGPRTEGVVVLIDEIDKADPDLPNNLLECLGSLQFRIHETGDVIHAIEPPLVVITTNDERELPAAFERRCAVLHLPDHSRANLVKIATLHFRSIDSPASWSADDREVLYGRIADRLTELRVEAREQDRREPSTAEYLDAIRACLALGAHPDDATGEWPHIEQLTLRKISMGSHTDTLEPAPTMPLGESMQPQPMSPIVSNSPART